MQSFAIALSLMFTVAWIGAAGRCIHLILRKKTVEAALGLHLRFVLALGSYVVLTGGASVALLFQGLTGWATLSALAGMFTVGLFLNGWLKALSNSIESTALEASSPLVKHLRERAPEIHRP